MISPNMDFKTEEAFFEEARQTLPRMSAFFMEGLYAPALEIADKDRCGTSRYKLKRIDFDRKFPKPSFTGTRKESQRILPHCSRRSNVLKPGRHQEEVVRSLVRGLSDHFDDLLMGIWGNTTLIRFNLPMKHPVYDRVAQMEKMIQEGAYLIQLILGYLGERRSVSKAVRLNQLVSHMACYLPQDQNHEHLAQCLQKGTKACQPRMIASATARIIELLLKGIDTFRHRIVMDTLDSPSIQQRIGIITALVKKGGMITSQLLCYAGDFPLQFKRTNITSIFNRQYRHACERYPHIRITKLITPHLPRMVIDPKNIEWVVAQLIENAADALPSGGRLRLSIKPFYAEDPRERCGLGCGMDYMVISVDDNGPGIDTKQGVGIFSPFYTELKTKNALGLGLAAADGIIRKHKGYIQLRSKPEQGSCFKIYLPVSV